MGKTETKLTLERKNNLPDISLGSNENQAKQLIAIIHYTLPTKKLCVWGRGNTGEFTVKIAVSGNEHGLSFRENIKPLTFWCSQMSKSDLTDERIIVFENTKDKSISFPLYFDPCSIEDCNIKLIERQEFDLPFVFSISNNNNKDDIQEVSSCLKVPLSRFTSEPIVTFTPNEKVVKDWKIKYQEIGDKTCIGTVAIRHNATFKAAPVIEKCNIKFQLKDRDHKNCLFDMQSGIHFNSSISISIDKLHPNNERVYPVYLEENNTPNPPENSEITFYYTYNETRKELKPSITILRDNTITEAAVQLKVPGNTPVELYKNYDDNTICLKQNLLNDPRFTDKITIVFKNLATESASSKAAVYIWGVKIKKEITEGKERLKLSSGSSFDDFVNITGPEETSINRLARGKNELNYKITLNKSLLKATLPAPDKNETYIEIEFTLKYNILVDKKGEQFNNYQNKEYEKIKSGVMEKTVIFKIKLCKECSPTIYCVDFGTSAITAGYFSFIHRRENYNPINLLEKKKKLISNIEQTVTEFDSEPSPFINSRIYFNEAYFAPDRTDKPRYDYISDSDDIIVMAKDYYNYPVRFSPAPNQLDPKHELPNLKTMIGHKNIPIAIGANEWTYKDKEGTLQYVFNGMANCPLFETTELFKICYRQLFTHFINPSQQNGDYNEQINKLVVTVPNTYTPKNIQDVKNIIRETIPTVYPEHLCFISESDAVACYYIDKKPLNDGEKETVLIYDMGAGTLDLTLLEHNRQGDEEDVNIIKKIGINIAGNYLDYTILLILADLFNDLEASKIKERERVLEILEQNQPFRFNENENGQPRIRDGLKNLIKEIKTKLNDCSKSKLESQKGEEYNIQIVREAVNGIKLEKILEHKLFKDEFLNNVTTDVFKNFFGNLSENEKIDIDVIVFSGRSTSLNAIRNAVQKNIRLYCEKPVKYANITDQRITLVDSIEKINTSSNILKNIVAKGACVYMNHYFKNNDSNKFNSHANYASFGIITHGRNDQLRYYPIIQKCADYDKTNDTIEGIIDITIQGENIAHINLVQSYSENTEIDYQNDELGLISTIMTVSTDNLTPFRDGEKRGKCTFKLVLNNQIKNPDKSVLEFYIVDVNGTIQADVEPQEDFESSTLRKSLWPVIFQ